LVFALLVLGFGILSAGTGWPNKESWGLVVLAALVIALLPLLGPVLTFLRESGAVLDIKGVKLDFTASATRGSVERSNLQDQPGVQVTDSNAADIAAAAQAARSASFVVIDLGVGRSWYPTRLFALAAAADELNGARAIVVLAQRGGVAGRFSGWIMPRDVVAAFCDRDPRYRAALNEARAILYHLRLSGGSVDYVWPQPSFNGNQFIRAYSEAGDLAFVPALIARLQQQTPQGLAAPGALEVPWQPAWLGAEEVERLLDPWLVREHVREDLPEAEKWAMLRRATGEFLAVTDDKGCYCGMIDLTAVVRRAVLSPAGAKF
jgi:hypothetical protein